MTSPISRSMSSPLWGGAPPHPLPGRAALAAAGLLAIYMAALAALALAVAAPASRLAGVARPVPPTPAQLARVGE